MATPGWKASASTSSSGTAVTVFGPAAWEAAGAETGSGISRVQESTMAVPIRPIQRDLFIYLIFL